MLSSRQLVIIVRFVSVHLVEKGTVLQGNRLAGLRWVAWPVCERGVAVRRCGLGRTGIGRAVLGIVLIRLPGRHPDFDKAHVFGQKTAHFFSSLDKPLSFSLTRAFAAALSFVPGSVGIGRGTTGRVHVRPSVVLLPGDIWVFCLGVLRGVVSGRRTRRPFCLLVGRLFLFARPLGLLKLNAAARLLGRLGLAVLSVL